MKIFLGLGVAVFLATSAGAAEIGYQFKTLDIVAPGQLSGSEMIEINDHGEILAGANFPSGLGAITTNRRGLKPKAHFCPGSIHTEGQGISNWGDVAGFCKTGDDAWSGFITRPDGQLTLLDYPGAYYTFAQGVSPNGRYVVGQFWAQDFSTHCFLWDSRGGAYRQIDPFPGAEPSTYVNCFAVNRRGQVLGEHIIFNEFGEYLERGFFVYDNGVVSVPLALLQDLEGGRPFWYAVDMNNDGAILAVMEPNDGTSSKLGFYDDGIVYDIKLPEGAWLNHLGGMNNDGQFVGRYDINGETHGFVASPAPIKVASKKK